MTLNVTLDARVAQRIPALPLLQQLDIKKLAVFRALQLGDMLCAVPALRALRAALPHAHITLVGLPWAEQFARRFSRYIDDFSAFPGHPELPEQAVQENRIPGFYHALRSRHFDLALQMHGNGEVSNHVVAAFGARVMAGFGCGNGESHSRWLLDYPETDAEPLRLLRLAEFLGTPPVGHELEFPLDALDEQELRDSGLNAGLTPGNYICIHPGARIRSKCWPPERFAQVADRLSQEFSLPVVLTGAASENDLTTAVARHMQGEAINAAAPISIGAMAALMRGARFLVCNDTGVSHIAAGLRLPSVVVFTSTDMCRWAPLDCALHRCIEDPDGSQVEAVLAQARALLKSTSA